MVLLEFEFPVKFLYFKFSGLGLVFTNQLRFKIRRLLALQKLLWADMLCADYFSCFSVDQLEKNCVVVQHVAQHIVRL